MSRHGHIKKPKIGGKTRGQYRHQLMMTGSGRVEAIHGKHCPGRPRKSVPHVTLVEEIILAIYGNDTDAD